MPRLSVPDRHKPALSKLLKLSDLGFNRLVEGLSAPFGKLSEVPSRVQVDSLQSNEIEQIIDVLISLYLVLASREISVDQFSEDLAQAMRPTWKNEASEDEISRFRARINTALSIEPFAIQAKLRELLSDDERNFCDVKIVSDLRPVFGLRVEDGPVGMAVRHMLQIGFHPARQKHESFYIWLNTQDLATFKQHIERAEAKAKSIEAQLSKAGMRHLKGAD